MKKIENTFVVTGFVGSNAEIRQFTNASVARFSLAVSRQEKNGEETNRVEHGSIEMHGQIPCQPLRPTAFPFRQ